MNNREMQMLKPMAALLFMSILSACASGPKVQYSIVTGEDFNGLTKFKFTGSTVSFDFMKDDNGTIDYSKGLKVTSIPYAFGDQRYAIKGTGLTENWGVVTQIVATPRTNDPDQILDLSVQSKDQVKEVIETATTALTTALPLFVAKESTAPPSDQPKLPTGIDVAKFLDELGGKLGPKCKQADRDKSFECENLTLSGTNDFTADLKMSERPVGALELSKIHFPFYSNSFLYSSCRNLQLTLKRTKNVNEIYRVSLSVADPKWVETIALPFSGKISVQPSCGAGASLSTAEQKNTLDYINALLSSAKSIKDALNGKAGAQ